MDNRNVAFDFAKFFVCASFVPLSTDTVLQDFLKTYIKICLAYIFITNIYQIFCLDFNVTCLVMLKLAVISERQCSRALQKS